MNGVRIQRLRTSKKDNPPGRNRRGYVGDCIKKERVVKDGQVRVRKVKNTSLLAGEAKTVKSSDQISDGTQSI